MSSILTLHNPARARRYYDAGHWQSETLYGLLRRNASERPDRFALRDSTRRLTWRELYGHVETLASTLAASGLQPGDRVAVWLPNRVETIMTTLACSRNGYICNPSLHQSYTVADVIGLLRRTSARVLIGQRGFGADARKNDVFAMAHREVPAILRLIELEPGSAEIDFGAAAPQGQSHAAVIDDPDKIVLLAFTSGTTGEPKGVMHSDNTLLANARAMAAEWSHHGDMVLLSMSPLTHAIGTIAMAQSLVSGFELVVNDIPKGSSTLDWLMETKATYVMGVPTHAIDLLADAERRRLDRLGDVSIFYMGGSAIPRETTRALLARGIVTQNVYGMTENGAHNFTRPDDALDTIVETCGRDCGCYEVKIFDPDNAEAELPAGAVGEVGGQGACLMLGYFGDQSATENSFNSGGWFMSGDLGRIDPQGNLQIVGRKKDIINRGGRKIYPGKIEDAARSHPAVLKVAVFPVADERLGEKVAVAVVLRDGFQLDAQELLAHLDSAGISRYDMPEYFAAMDTLPLTPSGKLLKRGLVEQVRSGTVKPEAVRWNG